MTADADGHELPSTRLSRLFRSNLLIVGGAVAAQNLTRLVSTIILTRLLSPDDFGAVAIIASVIVSLTMLTDAGFKAFVIRHVSGDAPDFLDAIWTIRLARAAFTAILVIALAAPLSAFFKKPDLTLGIALSSAIFLLQGLESMGEANALRAHRIARAMLLDIAPSLVQLLIAISLAYMIRSYWAIFWAMVVSSLARCILTYLIFPEPLRKLRWEPHLARELLGFARFVVPSSILTLLVGQIDKLTFSRLLSLTDFGIYSLAFSLAAAPAAFSYAYSSRVLYPRYAAAWRSESRLTPDMFYARRLPAAHIYMSAVGLMIGAANLIIGLLYDDRYGEAALYLSVLGLAPLFLILNVSTSEALIAMGRLGAGLLHNILRLGWIITAGILLFWSIGPLGLAVAVGMVELPVLLLSWSQLARQRILKPMLELGLICSALIGAIVGYVLSVSFSPMLRW
jgi:lipopolysaccharide exporter